MKNGLPANYQKVLEKSTAINFDMSSEPAFCSLLRTLVASKPYGQILEIGGGTGLATSWMLDGMDSDSVLTSIDNEEDYFQVAYTVLGSDGRLDLLCTDGNEWIKANRRKKFDLIFADAWPGKFSLLNETLEMVKSGGYYVIDDLLPQKNWPEGHDKKVVDLLAELQTKKDFFMTQLDWSTGIVIMTKK